MKHGLHLASRSTTHLCRHSSTSSYVSSQAGHSKVTGTHQHTDMHACFKTVLKFFYWPWMAWWVGTVSTLSRRVTVLLCCCERWSEHLSRYVLYYVASWSRYVIANARDASSRGGISFQAREFFFMVCSLVSFQNTTSADVRPLCYKH